MLRYVARGHSDRRVLALGVWSVGLIGFPLLPLILDVLMFLEPLTILGSLRLCLPAPMAEELITLLPYYRRMRVVLEVLLEGIPQSCLELYIYIKVHLVIGLGYCGDIERSRIGYSIGRAVLERSLALTALGIAKVAFEYFLDVEPDDDEDEDGVGEGGVTDGNPEGQPPPPPPATAGARVWRYVWRLIDLGHTESSGRVGGGEAGGAGGAARGDAAAAVLAAAAASGAATAPPPVQPCALRGDSRTGGCGVSSCLTKQLHRSNSEPVLPLPRGMGRGAVLDAAAVELMLINPSSIAMV